MEAEINKVKMDISEIKGDIKVLKTEFAASKECVADIKTDIKELGEKITGQIIQMGNQRAKDIMDLTQEFAKQKIESEKEIKENLKEKAGKWVEKLVVVIFGTIVAGFLAIWSNLK